MMRFSPTGETCAGALEATEGVADPVAGTVPACEADAVGAPSDPQALSTSRPLAANAILMASLIASFMWQRHHTRRAFGSITAHVHGCTDLEAAAWVRWW